MKRENIELKNKILNLLGSLNDEEDRSTRNIVLKLLGKSPNNVSYTQANRMMTLTRYYLNKLLKEGKIIRKKKMNAVIWELKKRGENNE